MIIDDSLKKETGKKKKINGVSYAEFITKIEIPISEKKYNDD